MQITAILPYSVGYWEEIQDGLHAGAEKLDVDVKIVCPSEGYSIPDITQLIKRATAAQTDAIIIQGADDTAYLEALEKASQEGIQIAFIDADVPQFPNRIYVGTDNYSAGQLMAEKLAELTDGQANVVVFIGEKNLPNLSSRLEGFLDGIAKYKSIQLSSIEETNYNSIAIIEKYRDICSQDSTVDTIICLDGTGSSAFSGTIGLSAPTQMNLLCFDIIGNTETALKDGIIDAILCQSPAEMGEQAVIKLYQCFNGQCNSPGCHLYGHRIYNNK